MSISNQKKKKSGKEGIEPKVIMKEQKGQKRQAVMDRMACQPWPADIARENNKQINPVYFWFHVNKISSLLFLTTDKWLTYTHAFGPTQHIYTQKVSLRIFHQHITSAIFGLIDPSADILVYEYVHEYII